MATTTTVDRKTGRAPRGSLNRDRILVKALEIADAEGLDGLTMRRVATVLGVDPMALYRYVDSKDSLLDGLVELLWREVPLPRRDPEDWVEPLRSFAHALRASMNAHPRVAPLLCTRNVFASPMLEAADIHLQNLRDVGFGESQAARILRAVLWTAVGDALGTLAYLACAGTLGSDDATSTEQLVQLGRLLPDDVAPSHIRAAVTLCACEPDADFEFTLNIILEGAQKLLPSASSA